MVISNSEKNTFLFGKQLAKKLKGGDVIVLSGNLGAGKTILTKGIAQSLGINKIINSPTFTIMKIYPLQIANKKLQAEKLVHIDCYRITDENDLLDIGADQYIGKKDSVVIIEWGEKVKKILPLSTKFITIKIGPDNSRTISMVKQTSINE